MMTTRQAPYVPLTSSGSDDDLAELILLLRELRSDVAALKQDNRQITVHVESTLDGKKIADNTVTRIINQTKSTGVNPLSAYI